MNRKRKRRISADSLTSPPPRVRRRAPGVGIGERYNQLGEYVIEDGLGEAFGDPFLETPSLRKRTFHERVPPRVGNQRVSREDQQENAQPVVLVRAVRNRRAQRPQQRTELNLEKTLVPGLRPGKVQPPEAAIGEQTPTHCTACNAV